MVGAHLDDERIYAWDCAASPSWVATSTTGTARSENAQLAWLTWCYRVGKDLGVHHSLVADLHRDEWGPVGWPEWLHFIEADGSLRVGHEAFNEFAPVTDNGGPASRGPSPYRPPCRWPDPVMAADGHRETRPVLELTGRPATRRSRPH